MPKFRVYPKRGESFTIQIVRFEFDKDGFRFYNAIGDHSQEGFISPRNVAAIVPEYPDLPKLPFGTPTYEVCLLGRDSDDRLSIQANMFDSQTPPSLIFYQITEGAAAVQLRIVKSTLGKIKLTDLQAKDIQGLYAGLSPSVARHVHAPLRSALSQAVKSNLIHSNPCDAVDLPRHKAREIQCLTREQASQLMAVQTITRTEPDGRVLIVENKHKALFGFMLTTGARPSECFAVKWSDIDFTSGHVTIQRSVEWLNKKQGGSWYFKDTKTKSSRRCVPLPASMLQQLREHRAAQNEALLKLGIRTDLVFASSEGTPLQRRNLSRRYYKPALKAAGLPENLSLCATAHMRDAFAPSQRTPQDRR